MTNKTRWLLKVIYFKSPHRGKAFVWMLPTCIYRPLQETQKTNKISVTNITHIYVAKMGKDGVENTMDMVFLFIPQLVFVTFLFFSFEGQPPKIKV